MTAPSEPLPLEVGSQLVPQARSTRLDASRFKLVPYSVWVDCHSCSLSKLAVSLTDDLNSCLRVVSLRNLSWTAVVNFDLPGLGLFFH